MARTTELGLGKIEETDLGEIAFRRGPVPRNGNGMKPWKKILLLSVGAAALVGLVVGGIVWSKRGVIAVQTGKVVRQDLKAVVTASGEIKPPSKNYANVNANSFGKIVELLVKEGDSVKAGQLLLRTESVQQEADVQAQEAGLRTSEADTSASDAAVRSAAAAMKTAEADLQQAQATFQRAKEDFARAKQMLAEQLIAQQLYDQRRSDFEVAEASVEAAKARQGQAKAQYQQATYNHDMARARVAQSRATLLRAKDVRSKTEYYSPLDGIVTSLPVHQGENVVPGIQNQPGSLLYQISDLSVMTAEVKVDEADIINVRLDQFADVTIDAIPNKTFKGHVTEIGQSAISRSTGLTSGQSSTASDEAKDFKVVVTLDDPPPNLRPGLSATAKVVTATRQNVVTIPIQALTIRQRRELEEGDKGSKDKALAASREPAAATPPSKNAAVATAAEPPVVSAPPPATSARGPAEVSSITIKAGAPGETFVYVATTGPVAYRVLRLTDPARLVVDLEEARKATPQAIYSAASPFLKAVRVSQFRPRDPAVVRLVADLAGDPAFDVHTQPGGIRIALKSGTLASVAKAPEPVAVPATSVKSEEKSSQKERGKEELQGVFVVRNGRVVFVPVETGIMGTTDMEILKGLEGNEEIVTGSYKALRTLKNKTKVKVDNTPAVPGAGLPSS